MCENLFKSVRLPSWEKWICNGFVAMVIMAGICYTDFQEEVGENGEE